MIKASFEDQWFDRLAALTRPENIRVPARLKSRIYSVLMQAEAAQGTLASLAECERAGGDLCLWERLIQLTPLPDGIKVLNYCRFCHSRALAERFEGVPLPWRGCPYARFQK